MFRIERAVSKASREKIYALRYRAYRRVDAIEYRPSEKFEDAYDQQPNAVLWAITRQGEVIGSIRSMWHDPAQPALGIPELERYGDEILRTVPPGRRLVCGNRFVIEPQADVPASCIPLLLLRLHIGAFCKKEDFGIAAVRAHHLKFYQRTLRLRRISEPKIYPGLTSSMVLTGSDLQDNLATVLERTPMLRPKGYERVFLDPAYQDAWESGLPLEF